MLTLAVVLVGAGTACALARSARQAAPARRVREVRRRPTPRLPIAVSVRVDRALTDAGFDVNGEVAVGWWLVGGGGAALLGLTVSPILGVLVAAAAVGVVPAVLAAGRARRRRALDDAVPELLERVAVELRSGGTVMVAVANRADASPLGLDCVVRRMAQGSGFTEALRVWSDGLNRRDVRAAAGALGLATTVGGRAADALDALAASLRARLAALADARALSAQAQLSAIVVGGAPVAFLAFIALADPAATQAQLGTPVGRVAVVFGLTLEAVAAVWIRRIVRSEP